tara:strand:- start:836 stop:1060 length:225 start_codon:yes stop_codon:yes gene_type:complete
MTYIIMARDECDTEVRIGSDTFATEERAVCKAVEEKENYPEYRCFWVEILKDKAYYLDLHTKMDPDDYVYGYYD